MHCARRLFGQLCIVEVPLRLDTRPSEKQLRAIMPKEIRVAFWNVQNLLEAGAVPRGPQSNAEADAKVDALARAIRAFFHGKGPDLLGLAEIGTRRLLDDLAAKLPGKYLKVWEPPAIATQTGLALLARETVFSQLHAVAVQRPVVIARPRSLVVRCELTGDELDRRGTARWFR